MTLDAILQIQEQRLRRQLMSTAPTKLTCCPEPAERVVVAYRVPLSEQQIRVKNARMRRYRRDKALRDQLRHDAQLAYARGQI